MQRRKEIDDVINNAIILYTYNTQTYRPNDYGELTIANSAKIGYLPLQASFPQVQRMNVIQEKVTSIERMLSLGLSSETWTLFRTFEEGTFKTPFPNQIGGVWFLMSFNRT